MINADQIHIISLMFWKIDRVAWAELLRYKKEGAFARFHVDKASYLWYQIVPFLDPDQLKRHLGLLAINSRSNNIEKVGWYVFRWKLSIPLKCKTSLLNTINFEHIFLQNMKLIIKPDLQIALRRNQVFKFIRLSSKIFR